MKNKKALIFPLLMMVFALVFTFISLDFPSRSRLAPKIVGIGTAVLLLIQILIETVPALNKYKNYGKVEIVDDRVKALKAEKKKKGSSQEEGKRLVNIWIWIIMLAAGLYLVGYLVTIPIFLFLFYNFKVGLKWIYSALVTAIVWTFIYVLFEVILHVELYRGILLNLLA